MPFFNWTKTASPNGDSDPTQSWVEGMAPSQINDSARSLLANLAQMIADQSGALVTTGSANTYSLATNSNFTSAAFLSGNMVAFTPHLTNTVGSPDVTLTIDSQANIPIRSAPNTPIAAGVLVAGAPVCVTFNQADNALYLQGFYGNQSVPIGGMIDYIGATSPFSNFVIPIGQAVSRTTFASLFALIGVTYGAGDGATTFNLPNLSGRVTAMIDAAGTVLPGTSAVGALVGSATVTLTAAEIPEITSNVQVSGGISGTGSANEISVDAGNNTLAFTPAGGSADGIPVSGSFSGSGAAQSNNTGGAAHPNVQPTMALTKLLRIA
jgi:microcystin-dependent protein